MLPNILIYVLIGLTIYYSAEWWRKGGDGQSLWRNPGVSILIASVKALITFNLWNFLYIPLMWGMLQLISYGVTAPPHKIAVWIIGSINGKLLNPAWKNMADNGQIVGVEALTRGMCGFCWSLPAALFAITGGSWLLFVLYVLFLATANAIIGSLVEDVEISEKGVGACVATSIVI